MKKKLRAAIRKEIKNIDGEHKRLFSQQLFSAIEQLPEFQSAHTVLAFWSLPDEVDTHDFIEKWAGDKRMLLPVIVGKELRIKQYESSGTLVQASYNISEPTGDFFTNYDEIDVIIVPGVAFDKQGNRLGRGKGYYDKLLPQLSGTKIGVCFPCQLVERIVPDRWDVQMDKILTVS
ncbi:MAG: 5-formyltetrahydrofolate cyclo-ligase [Bacteroidales bacterium]|jgi:5-formyltetrahydrofolate cyclo-ligase|nr:5-formyltetrahydrofolate cyclo-ligase [Bacteroidales bacterium]